MAPTEAVSPLLQSAPNFRDMGGYPSRDGRTVRAGHLFRSGILDLLSDEDLERLRQIGVRTVCDLRSDGERTRYTTAWHEHGGPAVLNFNLNVDIRGHEPEMMRLLRTDPSTESARAGMIANYGEMPVAMEPYLAPLFERLLDPAATPMLVHCHAGKDRTGFVCALVLLALDVPVEAVIADYMETGARHDMAGTAEMLVTMFAHYVPGTKLTAEIMMPIADVQPEYLQASLTAIEGRYGSLEQYLSQHGGLDAEKRGRLKAIHLV